MHNNKWVQQLAETYRMMTEYKVELPADEARSREIQARSAAEYQKQPVKYTLPTPPPPGARTPPAFRDLPPGFKFPKLPPDSSGLANNPPRIPQPGDAGPAGGWKFIDGKLWHPKFGYGENRGKILNPNTVDPDYKYRQDIIDR